MRKRIFNDNKPKIYNHKSTDTNDDLKESLKNYDTL